MLALLPVVFCGMGLAMAQTAEAAKTADSDKPAVLTAPSIGKTAIPSASELLKPIDTTPGKIQFKKPVPVPAKEPVGVGGASATTVTGKQPPTQFAEEQSPQATAETVVEDPVPASAPPPAVSASPQPAPAARGGTRAEPMPADPEAPPPAIRRPPSTAASLLEAELPSLEFSDADSDQPPAEDFEQAEIIVASSDIGRARAVAETLTPIGFRARSRSTLARLGLVLTVFRLPPDLAVADAVEVLRSSLAPDLVDANHRYRLLGSKRGYATELMNWQPDGGCPANARVGIIDTAVDPAAGRLDPGRVTLLDLLPAGREASRDPHGTRVAALLAAAESGAFRGMLPELELVAASVFEQTSQGPVTTAERLARAFDELLGHGVQVINVSLGGSDNRVLQAAVRAAVSAGAAVVAAAGNQGPGAPPVYPAAYPEVVAVTAIDARKRRYRDAAVGDYVDFSAPGVDVYVPMEGDGSGYFSGTSYAAPFITAAYAVLAAGGSVSSADTAAALRASSLDLGSRGHDPEFGWGLPDLGALCRSLAGYPATVGANGG